MKPLHRRLLLTAACSAALVHAALAAPAALALPGGDHRFENLFAPLRTSLIALSPDGKLLAYPVRSGSTVSVLIVAADQPGKVKTKIDVLTDEDATPQFSATKELTPARIDWLRWADGNRLVVQSNAQPSIHSGNTALNRELPQQWYSMPGVVVAFNADGSSPKTLVTPSDVGLKQYVPPKLKQNPDKITPPEEPTIAEKLEYKDIENDDEEDEDPYNPSRPKRPKPRVVITQGRRPQVIDFAAGDSNSIFVRATDPTAASERPPQIPDPEAPKFAVGRAEVFKVDIRTGKIESVGEDINPLGYAVMLDRQGHRALSVPNTSQTLFPHAYNYDPLDLKKAGAARPLDAIIGQTGPGFSVSPETYFSERSIPVGVDEDATTLYYASNVGRDTYAFYGLDLKTGQRTGLAFENPALDLYEPTPSPFAGPSPLIFDRFSRKLAGIRVLDQLGTTRWARPEMQAVQALCEKTLPGRTVEIQEWDERGTHILLLACGPTDPGAYYVFNRATNQLSEIITRAPQLDRTKLYPTLGIAVKGPDSTRLTGFVTSPRNARFKPAPVVVLCQPEPWSRVSAEYNPKVAALAEMGVVVVQLNPRCAWGSGAAQRAAAIKNGFEESASADIIAVLDWVQQHFEVSSKRIGIMGERRGAYLALRTLQLHPNRFRCAIALEPTVDIGNWIAENRWGDDAPVAPILTRAFFGSAKQLNRAPLLDHPETIKAGVLLLSYRGTPGQPTTSTHLDAARFASAVRRTGETAEFEELGDDYMARLPAATAEVFRRIEGFIGENIINFRVDVGDVETKKL